MEIEMKIRGLMIDPTANTPIVILKDVHSDVMLPIWVGPFEANAIAFEIEKMSPPRPMTHDLMRNLIIQVGGSVKRIVVTELKENTFYAVIELQVGERILFLDSRPSDAIALALRTDAPIFVNEEAGNPRSPGFPPTTISRASPTPSTPGWPCKTSWPKRPSWASA
ncbi:MAG TPA: bifunctional nuclease family protein [Acidobacteriota bacterium]|nr:bifunctional nuclease family protein [Acidobacteriota bacterium]